VDDMKKTYREGEETAKEEWRKHDGEDLADKVGNAGDDMRKNLGNAGDDMRKNLGNAGDDLDDATNDATAGDRGTTDPDRR
jgi:hypothetical protein